MFYKLMLVVVAITILAGCYYLKNKKENKQGIVIILNGPSAAGKSSIQKEFQAIMMPDLWIKLGIDNLFDNPLPNITPENMSYWQSKNSIRWVETHTDAEGKTSIPLFIGEEGKKVMYGMNRAIVAYAQAGCNCIVDYIAYEPEFFNDLQKRLKDNNIRTIYVAVDIPLEVLEEREKARGTSPVGHARSHYAAVYGTKEYDLRVNSEKNTANEIAHKIKEYIELNYGKK